MDGEGGSRTGFLLALALAVSLILLSIAAGSASAGSVTCSGNVAASEGHESENALDYSIKCSEDISAYSIVSNREINYFSTEVVAFAGDEVAEGEAFTCEGTIPANGIGCYGNATTGNTVVGTVGLTDELCEAYVQPRFWVVAQTTQLKKEVPFQLTSEPFPLAIKCETLNAKKKAKDRAKKVCGKVKSAASGKARTKARKRCKQAQAANKRAQLA
ncbi:MAG: hypothetical protein ACSLFD_03515 [Solirubrobacterales bacterium]